MKLGQLVDWMAKSLGRIKTIGLVVVVVLLGLSILRTGCDRDHMEGLVEKITGLDVQNDILNNGISERDSILLAKDSRIANLKDSLSSSEIRFQDLEDEYDELEDEYQGLEDSIQEVPVDTSYTFLTEEVYPLEGPGSYPFNEPQVRGIHLTFLEKLTLKDINGIMRDQIKELVFQTDVKDSVAMEYSASVELLKADTTDMRQIIDNKDQIIDAQDDHIKDQKRSKTIWQIIGGAIIAVLVAIVAAG